MMLARVSASSAVRTMAWGLRWFQARARRLSMARIARRKTAMSLLPLL